MRGIFGLALFSVATLLVVFGLAANAMSGPGWSVVSSPNNANNSSLYDVTCISTAQCWSAGYYFNGSDVAQTLIEQWNGSSWSIVSSPNTITTQNNYLNGVTCASATECWAVGEYFNGSVVTQTLIEQWNGNSWTIIVSPNTSTTQNNQLNHVTCASATQCWAVGFYNNGSGGAQTLIEQWDGSSWTIVSSPDTSATDNNYLNSVTCTSSTACWAVGDFNSGVDPTLIDQTLIEQWDGTAWTIIASPNTNSMQNNDLNAVTCTSATQCWAVGDFNSGVDQTLIEQWDGTSWAIVSSPNASTTQNNLLNGVTCASASECWASGYYFNAGVAQTLIEQWNGTSWNNISTSPNNIGSNFLEGIACPSTSQCWGVGYYTNSNGTQTLIEEYALTIPALTGVVSEFTHGSAGTFDLNLPLTSPRGVECRSSASLGAGNYTMIFNFVNNLASVGSASVSSGTGTISSSSIGPNPNQYTASLTGVSDQQYLTVSLGDAVDLQNNTGNVCGTMGVLIGNVTFSGRVSSADVSLVRQQTLQPVTSFNFSEDIDCSGRIDSTDVSIVRQQTLTSLPSPP